MRFIALIPLLLVSCVDPYGNPINPFAPMPPAPYTDQREQYRTQIRDDSQQQNQLAYERGISDARADASAGLSKSYARHFQSYSQTTQAAYQAGYDQGFVPALVPLPGSPIQSAPAPTTPPTYANPSSLYTPPPINDPTYSQGYDFGLRDRVAGRPNDPGAHVGRYDPRQRRSFERGYIDAYNSSNR